MLPLCVSLCVSVSMVLHNCVLFLVCLFVCVWNQFSTRFVCLKLTEETLNSNFESALFIWKLYKCTHTHTNTHTQASTCAFVKFETEKTNKHFLKLQMSADWHTIHSSYFFSVHFIFLAEFCSVETHFLKIMQETQHNFRVRFQRRKKKCSICWVRSITEAVQRQMGSMTS